jgi:hypothetical protein
MMRQDAVAAAIVRGESPSANSRNIRKTMAASAGLIRRSPCSALRAPEAGVTTS